MRNKKNLEYFQKYSRKKEKLKFFLSAKLGGRNFFKPWPRNCFSAATALHNTYHHELNKKSLLFWVDLIFEWYEGVMVFRGFIFTFCLETRGRENNWMRKTSVTDVVIFPQKCHSESTSWSQLCSKFFLD